MTRRTTRHCLHRPGIGVALWGAVASGLPASAWAQVAPPQAELSPERQAVALREEALRALQAGALDAALDAAERAVLLDTSNLTLRAREVQFEVLLARGELGRAGAVLRDYGAIATLPGGARAWHGRAGDRLAAETAEGWADLAAARQALSRVEASEDLEPIELAWKARLNWRLEVRDPEAARDLPALRAALQGATERQGLTPDDQRWLATAALRADVLEGEAACDQEAARRALMHLRALPGLREADWAWARLAELRLDLRALDAADRDDDARQRLEAFGRRQDLSEVERAWARGFEAQLDLEAALASRDRPKIEELRPAYEAWAPWEPACARLDLSATSRRASAPSPWLRLEAVGGVEGWRVNEPMGVPAELQEKLVLDELVLAPAVGARAAGFWPLAGALGVSGDVQVAVPFAAWQVEGAEQADGVGSVETALGLTWAPGGVELSLGVETTRLRVTGSDSGWHRVVLPQAAGAWSGSLGPGLARLEAAGGLSISAWSARGRASYALGQGDWRPTVGVSGRLAGGTVDWLAPEKGEESVQGALELPLKQVDGSVSINFGMEWRS